MPIVALSSKNQHAQSMNIDSCALINYSILVSTCLFDLSASLEFIEAEATFEKKWMNSSPVSKLLNMRYYCTAHVLVTTTQTRIASLALIGFPINTNTVITMTWLHPVQNPCRSAVLHFPLILMLPIVLPLFLLCLSRATSVVENDFSVT